MNLERYGYLRGRTYKEYNFYSEGPKGRIRKVVRFLLISDPFSQKYNLLLGDWSEELNDIDDTSITNNGDTEKILATMTILQIILLAFHYKSV